MNLYCKNRGYNLMLTFVFVVVTFHVMGQNSLLNDPPVFTEPRLDSAKEAFEVGELIPEPLIEKGDEGTGDIKYGFEGGTVIHQSGMYHFFTTEMYEDPMWINTRLAHWVSADGFDWQRRSTLFRGSGDFSGKDDRGSLWSPMPFYNEKEQRWNLFYVAYINKPRVHHNNDPAAPLNPVHNHGKVWRAVSTISGKEGIGGPYQDVEIVLQPDSTSGEWEGVQGTDSFFLYPVKDSFYAFFGSLSVQGNSRFWGVGLAKAPEMSGPWKRCSELNPVLMNDYFTENPIVTKAADGSYLAFFDAGFNGSFGYSISEDGKHWRKGTLVRINDHPDSWWAVMRTPLSCIPEGNGVYRVYFTAYDNNPWATEEFPPKRDDLFGCLGMVYMKLEWD